LALKILLNLQFTGNVLRHNIINVYAVNLSIIQWLQTSRWSPDCLRMRSYRILYGARTVTGHSTSYHS
jgi:hypothetical protein